MNLWFYIIAGALIWTIGDIFIKYWVENNQLLHWGIGIIIWTVGLVFLAQSFHYKHMAIASIMMMTVNSIFIIIVSWILFKETVSLAQMGGIAVCIAGLYLLEVS
jgi:multidrug transporter EmrE-like cation transporter